MVAKHLGKEDADLPNYIQMGATGRAGAGFLGPRFAPLVVGENAGAVSFPGARDESGSAASSVALVRQ